MIQPETYEELAQYAEKGNNIFFFTADWCGDCRYIHPMMPEIETAFPDWQFIEVDRDRFIDLAAQWQIFGIPSFVGIKDGQEKGRLVNKNRKTKEEIIDFLHTL